jgi:DNA mismatch repair ATPase MutS
MVFIFLYKKVDNLKTELSRITPSEIIISKELYKDENIKVILKVFNI